MTGVLAQTAVATDTTVDVAQTLAFLTIGIGAGILAYYLGVSVREILVEPYKDRWAWLTVGVAAAVVYAASGLAELLTGSGAAATFQTGATLFFFLFSAVGVRALYATVALDRGGFDGLDVPEWARYAVLGAFIVAWWGAYLFGPVGIVGIVETVGLAGAVAYTLSFAVLTVRDAEGTSIAAIVRQFVPALLCFAAVVAAEQADRYTGLDPGVVAGVELVGTVLVGAFLFTTAVAIRQQSGEVSRLYDKTTWRGERAE
jgi:hypothetical protein